MAVQQQFCYVPLLGFAQNNIQYPRVVPFKLFLFSFFFVNIQLVTPSKSANKATAKNSRFILSQRLNLCIAVYLSIAVPTFPMLM